ncbi:MAG: protease modulator HflK [Phycisphaerales bacterium]|nr:protease modulator HflK [Phycisphaerales bacterium]
MAHTHHHHHHHHHHHGPVDDAHDAPLDAANQSLADALKASFRILKFVMFVLVVLYCFSGIHCIETNEEAVVLRFGKLLPDVRPAGLSYAFPYPIDETIIVPTKKDNKLSVEHWPKVSAALKDEPLDKSRPAGGLDPTIDGALLTADKGMVHMRWDVLYRITDLRKYVRYVADAQNDKIEDLITNLLDNVAIHVVAQYPAEAVTRGKTTEVRDKVRHEVNDRLEALETGLTIVGLDVPKSSVPGQTISAFNEVTKAENEKQKLIREAEQKADDILNQAAGEQYKTLLAKMDEYELAVDTKRTEDADRLLSEIDGMLTTSVGGAAGRAIRRANSYYTNVVQAVRGDVDEYRAALEEYTTSPELFIHRMWERTRERVLQLEGVKKHFVPSIMDELRIKIGPDPEQRKIDEQRKLQEEAANYDFSTPKGIRRIDPE